MKDKTFLSEDKDNTILHKKNIILVLKNIEHFSGERQGNKYTGAHKQKIDLFLGISNIFQLKGKGNTYTGAHKQKYICS